MNVYYRFELEVAGPVTDAHTEALGGQLAAKDGIDATVQADHRGGVIMFSREADDAVQAIVWAIEDVETAGMIVAGQGMRELPKHDRPLVARLVA